MKIILASKSKRRQELLKNSIKTRKIDLNYHDSSTSFLEAAFARGDRRLGAVLESAFKKGCKFDSWNECFDLQKWEEAFNESGIDPKFYSERQRSFEEINPWDHIDYAVKKDFLIKENKSAHGEATTPNCREKCSNCGANCYKGGVCFEKR